MIVLCGFIACAIVYLNRQKSSPPVSAPVVESSPKPMEQTPPEKVVVSRQESQPAVSQSTNELTQTQTSTPATDETQSDDSTNSIHKLVDALLTAKSGGQKNALFDQLRKTGQLDAAIAELKQRMADNPNDPEIPTTLGEAQLNEIRALHEAGADTDQIGILAMQADQNFNAALKIDPSNYEAQLVKGISMTYWPADPARDGQVVQTLSSLIDRQATMPSQPDFAQTYVFLGNEFQKIGQPEKAQATWLLGAQKFPSDTTLQQKINGQ
ncbi:MAG: hypothetical protein ACREC8_07320 [Limisphaerales bacterium]